MTIPKAAKPIQLRQEDYNVKKQDIIWNHLPKDLFLLQRPIQLHNPQVHSSTGTLFLKLVQWRIQEQCMKLDFNTTTQFLPPNKAILRAVLFPFKRVNRRDFANYLIKQQLIILLPYQRSSFFLLPEGFRQDWRPELSFGKTNPWRNQRQLPWQTLSI